MDVLKVQLTLRGYHAWVLRRLMERKREPLADTASYLYARWIDENMEFLAGRGLSIQDFEDAMESREKIKEFSRKEPG